MTLYFSYVNKMIKSRLFQDNIYKRLMKTEIVTFKIYNNKLLNDEYAISCKNYFNCCIVQSYYTVIHNLMLSSIFSLYSVFFYY